MYVLGIEAATPVAGVAVVDEKKVLAERFVNNKLTHSVNLLPMIKDVIKDAQVEPGQLEGIAVSSGPGSFTGLRIGMTTAKTLAHVWNLPVVPVSTLDALAYPVTGYDGLVCPILNARKNEVYSAVYQGREKGIKRLTNLMAVSIEELKKILCRWQDKVLFLGDGVDIYYQQIKDMGRRADFAAFSANLPRGAAVAEIGLKKLKKGEAISALEVKPEYIRLSEAEVKWAEKNKSAGKCNCGN
ncbi:MAG: tRNA (adenosine(37)-N6)-threonylcarbamoyltransferase complex dimerization subunit type 1 TsaB [Desulfotomaculum sp.]|nr:tRNA (adenosine(37)-N6)-threonylcarbamoyltransferase complex dimerization subunit type 1 TsaB [Desulfotomaculum sp.]